MNEEKMGRILHSQRSVPYLAMFAAAAGAVGCIRHLIHLDQWHAAIFTGAENAVLIPTMVVLWRSYRSSESIAVRYIAFIGLSGVCLASGLSDLAIGMIS